eukprot:m51a1_g10584 putative tubby protein homolog isoform x2 (237) ;mRNA; f:49934-50841
MIQCKMTCMSRGMIERMHPTYFVFLEENDQFLLAARKRVAASSEYLISTDQGDIERGSGSFVGCLRSNFLGTEFMLYDGGEVAVKTSNPSLIRQELVSVLYESNVLGLGGTRKMTVLLPERVQDSEGFVENQPRYGDPSLIERFKAGRNQYVVQLHNKAPVWDDELQAYMLNFHKRVKLPSVKNFQVVSASDEDDLLMQFGRVSENSFSLDYKYPFCLVQALGVALSSVDNKIACE